jgi:Collagen triple helix repeat (20 copies)
MKSVRHSLRSRPWLRPWVDAIALLAVCAFLGMGQAWGAQAILVADAHVNSAMPGVNSGSISNLDVGSGYTTLLQFDLSMLPQGTTAPQVSRAVLRVYVNRVTTPGLVAYAPVTGAWGEYSVTYATQPPIGSAAGVVSVSQAGTFVAIDVTTLVQGWIGSPATNNGLALSAGTAMVQFDSKENDETAHSATLDIELVDAGPTGATGAIGPAGANGAIGVTGAGGLTGAAGADGARGQVGPIGPQGQNGINGANGPMGPQGLTGPAGPIGPAGSGGSGGLNYQGVYASTSNYSTGDVVVYQGTSYTSLIASNHGNTPSLNPQQWGVLATQGVAGPTGAAGATGTPGPQGLPGSVGPNGPIGQQGIQGIAGQAGAQGIPGLAGTAGLSGPIGPQGTAGPVGLAFQGAYASTANYALADGVSYKGAGYVSLIASNHGNTPDQSPLQWAIFAAAGANGATGPAGLTGSTGAAGPAGLPGLLGATGSTGGIGPQGPPVANYLGNYQSSANYARNDAVSWQGSTYISLAAGNFGSTPSLSPAQWAVLASQGASGATGLAGATGATGALGPAGAAGSAGAQGPPAVFQGQWRFDSSYSVGDAIGYLGSSYVALSANVGREPDISPVYWALLAAAGAVGPAGQQGLTGFQGPSGNAGQVGATGSQGPAGPTGLAGPTGTTGQQGATGQVGPAGAAGGTGANGIPGINGTIGTNGAPGPPGMAFRGAWLTGYGYAANDAVTYGNPTSTYIAQSGNTSQDPVDNPGVWIVLAQAGGNGPTGAQGAAAMVSVDPAGTTTGPAGSAATVTNLGNSSAAILHFTIPQGATGPAGSGGGGSGTVGIQGSSVYHTVFGGSPLYLSYYSVNNSTSTSSELGLLTVPYSVLTWVPNGCTASALNVYSQQNGPITVTLRVSTTSAPTSMADTALVCTSVAKNASCSSTGSSVTISPGSFVDMRIDGADNNPAAIWTALTCN